MEKLLLTVKETAEFVGVSQSAQVAADLRAAAEVLRRDGWTQHDYTKADGCKCLVGALNYATGSSPWVGTDRALEARAVLMQHLGTGAIQWNDRWGRTADEVIAALLAAADAAEAPDCIHHASCEVGDHTRSWPCDYAPGTGSLVAEAKS